LAGEHDAVAISPSTITLRKGEQQVARITRLDAAPADPAVAEVRSRPERLYQGTPESVWQRQLEAELAPLSKLEAAQALVVLAGELPPERWIDRILEIGGILVETGWGEQAYRLPLDYVHIKRTDDMTPIQNAPAWTGAIARMTDAESVTGAWTNLRAMIVEQQQRLAIPPMLLAQQLGRAVATGDAPVSAFAASLILEPGIGGSILRDPAAVRSVVERLDAPMDPFERQAVLALIAAWLYEAGAEQDRQRMVTHMNELAERLLEDSSSRLHAEIADAWVRVVWVRHRVSGESVPPPPTVDAALAARLVYQRLVASKDLALLRWFEPPEFSPYRPYRTTSGNYRRNSSFFLHEWISLINQHLADETIDANTYEAILASLDAVLRVRMPDDPWDVHTTAELLTERLRRAWTREETPSLHELDTTSLTHHVVLAVVRIRGTVPDFVRSPPPWMDAWEQLMSTTIWTTVQSVHPNSHLAVLYGERELTPLGYMAPYQAVQLAVGTQPGKLLPTTVLSLLWRLEDRHRSPDMLLLLSIFAELSGQDEETDKRMERVLRVAPYFQHIQDLLDSDTALRSIAHDLLTRIAQEAVDPSLREAIHLNERYSARQPESAAGPVSEPAPKDDPCESERLGETVDRRFRFMFRYQQWKDVLQWLAEQAEMSLVMDAPPPGTFNYSDTREYTPEEAIDMLNGVLIVKGYTLGAAAGYSCCSIFPRACRRGWCSKSR
jgi:hypothetical protein